MLAQHHTRGVWNITTHYTKVLCPDGVRRYATATTGIADTWFSMPAFVKVKDMSVSGYVTGIETEVDGEFMRDYEFHSYTYGKNYDFLPNRS